MAISGWVIVNFYTALLLILLMIFQSKTVRTKAGTNFVCILGMTLVLVFAETVGHIGELYPDRFIIWMKFGYYVIYALDPADYLFALVYINCWLIPEKAKCQKLFSALYRGFMATNFILVTISVLFNLKWFYYFEGFEYHRGSLFYYRGALILLFCLLMSVYALINRKSIAPGYVLPIFILPIISLFGAFLQIFISDLNMTYASISIGLLIVFFYLQTKNLDVDYLTGALNRRGIDISVEEKIQYSLATGQKFAAIMMDLDRFKEINDNYGHHEGDYALMVVSNILFKVFPPKSSIGRFGGDEFCVVCDIDALEELRAKVDMIEDELDLWNYKSEKPYKLQASIGSMIYDPANNMTTKQFQIAIDELMYKEKRKHHLADNRRA